MALAPGTRLGPYEIAAPLGAGGMGEVYKARDTRLDRAVAIKVLPQHLSSDPERKQRFEREAKAISSLQHPHICTLHDVGSQDGVDFLVMEHLEGETLAERLKKGALPTEYVLRIGMEVADALDKAHRHGVVHRDLKPGNIMLTRSGTKLLDFGLAKPTGATMGSAPLPEALTAASPASPGSPTTPLTQHGTVVGTFQYMSPEQIEGKEADSRTDIFALGAVLYEMATGKRAFDGKSQLSVASAILERDPEPISCVQPLAPLALEHVVKTCLAKDPEERWQSAADVKRELKWVAEGGSTVGALPASAAVSRKVRERAWRVATILLAVSTLALGVAFFAARQAVTTPRVIRLAVTLPAGQTLALGEQPAVALSPDAASLAYVAEAGGARLLYFRPMDRLEASPLPGTDGASSPFFSPDGQWIGFFAEGKLKKVSVQGGPPVTLSEAPQNRGGTWTLDDTIIFTPTPNVGLARVAAAGGPTQVLTTPDAAQGERTHRWPEVLPGGKAIVFTLGSLTSPDYYLDAKIAVLSLDTGKIKLLPVAGTNVHYSPSGHLVFVSQGGLFAAPFDPRKLEVTGAAVPVLEGVNLDSTTGAVHYSISRTGSLVYIPGNPHGASAPLAWISRKGSTELLAAPARPYGDPHLSPDGKRLVVTIGGSRKSDVWVYEISRNTLTRLTFEGSNFSPLWTPDGKKIVYASERSGAANLGMYWKNADGSGTEERLTTSSNYQLPESWSRDGKLLAFTEFDTKTQGDIWVLPLEGKREARLFLKTPFYEQDPKFSPDGRWLAYRSSESGQQEIYVQAFPGPGGKWQISTGGGAYPLWARNGRELFYYSGSRLMGVTITIQPSFAASSPLPLVEGRPSSPGALANSLYDVSPDGQQFLMAKETGPESASTHIHVVLDWTTDLKRQVPAGKN